MSPVKHKAYFLFPVMQQTTKTKKYCRILKAFNPHPVHGAASPALHISATGQAIK